VGNAISWAFSKFGQNAGPLIVVALIMLAVQLLFSFVSQQITNPIASLIVNVLGYALSLVISMPLVRAALTIANGGKVEIGRLFEFTGIERYALASFVQGVIVVVGLLLCVLPGLAAYLLLAFTPFFVVERNMGIDALGASFNMAKQHIGQLILFALFWIVATIVGLLLCFVGLLAAMPITYLAAAHLYRQMTGTAVAP
jgi:uncharacterized membrane protein